MTADLSTLRGAALRRAFDEAHAVRGLDPAHHYSVVLDELFGMTEQELVEKYGPDWYQEGDDACQGALDVFLRQMIRAFESLDCEDTAALALHQVRAKREMKEQIRALVARQEAGGGEGGER